MTRWTLFIPMGWEFEMSLGLLPSRHFSVRCRGWQIGPRPRRSIPPRGSHSLKKFCCRWGNVREGVEGVKQQGLVCDKEDKCQCWICFSGRQNCTVAILAQGTHWAVAVTQAFLPRLDSHGSHFLDPFHPYGLGV